MHLIGHSLGSQINGLIAINLAEQLKPVAQVTVLDRPFGSILTGTLTGLGFGKAEDALFDAVIDLGIPPILDNYIGTSNEAPRGTGSSIRRATHNLPLNRNHPGVHEYYLETIHDPGIDDGFQCSFIVGGVGCPAGVLETFVYRPERLFTIDFLEERTGLSPWEIVDVAFRSIVEDFVSAGGLAVADFTENSPAYLWSDFTIPEGADCLTFDFLWRNLGDGDFFTVSFGTDLLFSYLGTSFSGTAQKSSECVPVSHLTGDRKQLLFALNSVGASGAELLLGNIAFYSLREAADVTAPATILLLAANIFVLLWRRGKLLS